MLGALKQEFSSWGFYDGVPSVDADVYSRFRRAGVTMMNLSQRHVTENVLNAVVLQSSWVFGGFH